MQNFKKIKGLISKLEKRQKELVTYKAKIAKLQQEIKTIETELANLLNSNNNQVGSFSSYNS